MSKATVQIGMPTYDAAEKDYLKGLLEMITYDLSHDRHIQGIIPVEGHPVAKVRNEIVVRFLQQTTSDYLLWIDVDELVPKFSVERLVSMGAPVAAGWYYGLLDKGIFPILQYELGDVNGWVEDMADRIRSRKPFDVALAAAGFTMIHRDVFEKLEFPWYDYGTGCFGGTEDSFFTHRIHEEGYRYRVDPVLYAEHFKKIPVGEFSRQLLGSNGMKERVQAEMESIREVWNDYV